MVFSSLRYSAKISMEMTNRVGDNGHPCHSPLSGLKKSERLPSLIIHVSTPWYMVSIHLINNGGKLKKRKAFSIKLHSIESKAFLNSIFMRLPFIFLFYSILSGFGHVGYLCQYICH